MPKGNKNKKNSEIPNQPASKCEETPEQEDLETEEWMAKYTGENHMTWFIGVLKTHAAKAVKELLPELEKQIMECLGII